MRRSVVVCVGNELRGDDGVALLFYENLKRDEEIGRVASVVKMGSGVTIKPFEQAERVIVVDAVDFRGRPGEVKVFGLEEIEEMAGFTHKPALSALLSSAGVKEVHIIGVQPKMLEMGGEVSKECVSAYSRVREVILHLLSS